MPATYTPLLRLTKPGLGDTGWGTTVNDGTTELVDTSVAGTASVDVTSGNVTLSTANGATDQARNMFLRVFGASVAREVIVPATSKLYFVVNECTAAVTVKVSGQTGVAIPASSTAVVRCNGTDVVTSLNYAPSLTLGAALAAASGGTGQASYTTGDLLYATGATALSKLGIGTNGQILTSTGTAPQWSTLSGVAVTTFSAGTTGFTPNSATSGAVTLAGTLATTNGGTGLTSFTANGVVYASSTSALATGSALTFDGTNLGVGGAATGISGYSVVSQNAATGATLEQRISGALSGSLTTDTQMTLKSVANLPLVFGVNNAEQMRLTSTGLGIGTTPSYRLDVNGTSRFSGAIGVGNAPAVYGGQIEIYTNSNSPNNGIWVRNDSNGASSKAGIVLNAAGNSWRMAMGSIANNSNALTWDLDVSAPSTLMTLTTSGNLGIGTSSPGYRLDVVGVGKASSAFAIGDSSGNLSGTFTNESDVSKSVTFTADPANVGASSFMRWNVDGSERMRLDASGNLGIGTSSPRGDLDVSSGGTATLVTKSIHLGYSAVNFYGFRITNVNTPSSTYGGTFSIQRGTGSAWNDDVVLDNSGNLGLGVTPSAWIIRGLQVASSSVANDVNDTYLTANGYFDGSWKYINSDFAAQYYQVNGVHAWRTAPSGTAGNAISFTEAMTLDASGRLLVGYTSNQDGSALQVNANSVGSALYTAAFNNSSTSTSAYNSVRFAQGAAGSAVGYVGTGGSAVGNAAWQNNFVVGTQTSNALVFNTNDTERARITSGGEFQIGAVNDGNARLTVSGAAGFPTCGISLYETSASARRLRLSQASSGVIYDATYGSGDNAHIWQIASVERARIPAAGGMVVGTAALATTATDGFLYVPTCAGTPTGTPTTQTGTAPIVIDTTNNKLYFYSGGQWRDAGP